MKKLLIIAFSVLTSNFFSSCSFDKGREIVSYSYGTLYSAGSDKYVLCDDNEKMLLQDSYNIESYIGKRVFVVGGLNSKASNGYSSIMSLKLIKEVMVCNLQLIDSLFSVNDFGTMGISQDVKNYGGASFYGKYVNFIFSIVAKDPKAHTLNYIFDTSKKEISQNRATLYIRHKSFEDKSVAIDFHQMYTSVDISRIFEIKKVNKILLTINYIDMYSNEREETIEVVNDK